MKGGLTIPLLSLLNVESEKEFLINNPEHATRRNNNFLSRFDKNYLQKFFISDDHPIHFEIDDLFNENDNQKSMENLNENHNENHSENQMSENQQSENQTNNKENIV
jgi:hypothetical protein